jgi:hypothetical protein
VAKQLGGKIQGIDPGAGLMQASEKAIKTYGLDYELVSASDAGMLAAVERAERRKEWIVATSWSPHWMFSKYQLRYLKDPKGALGGLETVNAVGRKGFYQELPEAYAFLSRFNIELPDLESIMFAAQASSVEQAVGRLRRQEPEARRLLGHRQGGLTGPGRGRGAAPLPPSPSALLAEVAVTAGSAGWPSKVVTPPASHVSRTAGFLASQARAAASGSCRSSRMAPMISFSIGSENTAFSRSLPTFGHSAR